MAEIQGISSDKPVGPIKLAYVYKGACDTCRNPVETLEQDIDVDGKERHFVLAYCLNCKKQLLNKEVKKLE